MDKEQLVSKSLTVLQVLPSLESGGVERGTLEVGQYLTQKGHRSLVMSAGGRQVSKLEQEGSEHFSWAIGKKSLWTFTLVSQLRRFLKDQKVDILHVRSRMPAWICYLAWKGMPEDARPKFVTTVHGPYSVGPYSAVMTKGERVIAISEMIRAYIISHYDVPVDKIRLIYRGVDPAFFSSGYQPTESWMNSWCQQYPSLMGKRLLTLPARLTRWKGQQDFIDLIANMIATGNDVHGIIVGEAQEGKENYLVDLKLRVIKLGIEPHITFLGHRHDVREVMAISKIVYSLSTQPEAFGRTTLEALSMGVPVIGYNHGGVSEILNAFLPQGAVELGNQKQLLAVTQAFLNAAPKVKSDVSFTLESMLEKTVATYQELMV